MAGSGVTLYATTAGGNKVVIGSIDWREDTYMPSQINDNVAQIMADIRAMANDIAYGWIEIGDTSGVYTATYGSANGFFILGVDVTPHYRVGMRVRVVAPTPGVLTGTITASTFATNTAVTVSWDAGSLSNEAITAVQIGVGSGDTAVASGGTRHDCRFDYVNTSTCRLSRYGGDKITIDGVLRTIPAAGVDLTYIWGSAGASRVYVYAGWSGSAITFTVDTVAPAVDARDGNMVHSTTPSLTLVGMAVVGLGSFLQDATRLGVLSYWNRRSFALTAAVVGVTTPSTSPVIVTALTLNALNWSDELVQLSHVGYAANSGALQFCANDIYADGSSLGVATLSHSASATVMTNQTTMSANIMASAWHIFAPYVYVSGGGGTWYTRFSVSTRG